MWGGGKGREATGPVFSDISFNSQYLNFCGSCDRAPPKSSIYQAGGWHEHREKEKHVALLEGMHAQLFWINPGPGAWAAILMAGATQAKRSTLIGPEEQG